MRPLMLAVCFAILLLFLPTQGHTAPDKACRPCDSCDDRACRHGCRVLGDARPSQ